MNETRTSTSAKDAYAKAAKDIGQLMGWFECELQSHRERAEAEPRDWGYAGDLGHVRNQLIETLAQFSGFEIDDIRQSLDEDD